MKTKNLVYFFLIFSALKADFSYMPANLRSRIEDNDENTKVFNDTERSTILAKSQADRVSDLQAADELMRRFINEIMLYEMNEYALTEYNPAGENQIEFYVVSEGIVNSGTDVICRATCGSYNDKIFNLFIGQAEGHTLDGTQTTLRDNLYTTLDNATGPESIANRKKRRVIHPTT